MMDEQRREGPLIEPDDVVAIATLDMIEYKHPPQQIILNALAEVSDPITLLRGAPTRGLEGFKKSKPYSAACNPVYHAAHSSGRRPLDQIWWHIIHSTESDNPSALGVARYFTMQSAGGSTQYVNDDYECYRCLRDDQIPWGAFGANYHGLHYEQQGKAGWLTYMWSRKHRRTLNRTAWKVARDCKKYGNPVKWLKEADLRANKKGITDHATCSRAFGGSHWDPGPNYPRALFMSVVRTFYVVIKVRRIA